MKRTYSNILSQETEPMSSQGTIFKYARKQHKGVKKYSMAYKPVPKFRSIIRKELQNLAEVKRTSYLFSLVPTCLQNSTASLTNNYIVLNPSNSGNGYSISTGSTQGDMIGNRIRLKKATFKFAITATQYNASTNPFPQPLCIRFWFFSQRANPTTAITAAQVCTNATATFFDDVSGGTTGFHGTSQDMLLFMNKDDWRYKRHIDVKIAPAQPQGSSTLVTQYLTNNDFSFYREFNVDITKMLPVNQTKDDAGTWQEPWIYCLAQVIAADQTYGALTGTWQTCNWRGAVHYEYSDV